LFRKDAIGGRKKKSKKTKKTKQTKQTKQQQKKKKKKKKNLFSSLTGAPSNFTNCRICESA
jgi:hypothetical protein